MSHERSFGLMNRPELEVKKAYDSFRVKTISEGPIQQLRNYGVLGIDEAAYSAFYNLPGLKERQLTYLKKQLAQTNNALRHHQDEPLEAWHELIVTTTPNPATFFTLRGERNALRRARLLEMRQGGSRLYPSERIRYGRARFEEGKVSLSDRLGDIGSAIVDNVSHTIAVGAAVLAIIPGIHWIQNAKVYEQAKAVYLAQGDIAQTAYPVKRTAPSSLGAAKFNLIYIPEVTIDLGDSGEFVTPEKESDPQAARRNVQRARTLIATTLESGKLRDLEELTAQEIVLIERHRDTANATLDAAAGSLTFAFDTEENYPSVISTISDGEQYAQQAVDVLETHLDRTIVEDENNAFAHKQNSKWWTLGFLTASAIGWANAFRNGWRSRQSNRYYGYR